MRRAIGLADGENPHPNPRVGAIVFDAQGVVIGEGAHAGPGQEHAEIAALREAGDRARGGTLVVTLEPCVHHGRTPPCVGAIVGAGIGSVVVGALDPDERVAGKGIGALRQAGVSVTTGLLDDDVHAMDEGYFHHRRTGLPLVRVKLAVTLDGETAAADGSSQWITGEPSRQDAHHLRSRSDAIVVGAGTVIADDPELTVRLAGTDRPQPRPVIVVGSRDLPADAAVMSRNPLIYSARPLAGPGEVVVVPGTEHRVDLAAVAKDLASRGFLSVLVDGGRTLTAELLSAGVADKVVVYVGAMLAGGRGSGTTEVWRTLSDAHRVVIDRVTPLGSDLRIDASVVR